MPLSTEKLIPLLSLNCFVVSISEVDLHNVAFRKIVQYR